MSFTIDHFSPKPDRSLDRAKDYIGSGSQAVKIRLMDDGPDRVYKTLRARLISGEFPIGAALPEVMLAKQMGVSRTPIREAINRLISDGLITRSPNIGATVRTLTLKELADLLDLRRVLECQAAARAARRITPPQLAEMEFNVQRMEAIMRETVGRRRVVKKVMCEYMLLDTAFHVMIMRAAGNEQILETVRHARMLANVCGQSGWPLSPFLHKLTTATNEHRAIFEALAVGNPKMARKAMSDHLLNARRTHLRSYSRAIRGVQGFLIWPVSVVDSLDEIERRRPIADSAAPQQAANARAEEDQTVE